MLDTRNNIMLFEARKAKHKPNIVLQILIFIGVIFASQMAVGLVVGIPMGVMVTKDIMQAMVSSDTFVTFDSYLSIVSDYVRNLPQWFTVLSLFATAIITLLAIVCCRGIEGRSSASMGLSKKGMLKNYGVGYLVGMAMISATVVLSVSFGGAKFTGFNQGVSLLYVVLFFLGFLVQGMSEEVFFRGYFMVSCANRVHVAIAVFISSLAFSAMHLANPGITLFAVFNLTLFGVFAAIYVLRTDDLWGACAIHSAWNFLQGNIFGISVSGGGVSTSVFGTTFVEGREFLSGGAFGIEGGVCTTIVLIIGIALVLFLPQEKRPELPQEERLTEEDPSHREPLPVYFEK